MRFGQLIAYGLVVGISIRILETIWRRAWNIETGPWESGALAGALVGLFVICLRMKAEPLNAGVATSIVLLVYFLGKLLKKYLGG